MRGAFITWPEAEPASTFWLTTFARQDAGSDSTIVSIHRPIEQSLRAIAFILEYPEAIDSYMREQDARWDMFREEHPLPEKMLEDFWRIEERPGPLEDTISSRR